MASLLFCTACKTTTILEYPDEKRSMGFEIRLPHGWKYGKADGWDSFVGLVVGKGVSLNFDMSSDGYANSLDRSASDSIEQIPWRQIASIDTVDGFYRKIILPDHIVEGLTGIYLQDLQSSLNFNLYGYDLSAKDQRRACRSFRTIKIIRSRAD